MDNITLDIPFDLAGSKLTEFCENLLPKSSIFTSFFHKLGYQNIDVTEIVGDNYDALNDMQEIYGFIVACNEYPDYESLSNLIPIPEMSMTKTPKEGDIITLYDLDENMCGCFSIFSILLNNPLLIGNNPLLKDIFKCRYQLPSFDLSAFIKNSDTIYSINNSFQHMYKNIIMFDDERERSHTPHYMSCILHSGNAFLLDPEFNDPIQLTHIETTLSNEISINNHINTETSSFISPVTPTTPVTPVTPTTPVTPVTPTTPVTPVTPTTPITPVTNSSIIDSNIPDTLIQTELNSKIPKLSTSVSPQIISPSSLSSSPIEHISASSPFSVCGTSGTFMNRETAEIAIRSLYEYETKNKYINNYNIGKIFCVHKSPLFILREKRKSLLYIISIYKKNGSTLKPSEQTRLEESEKEVKEIEEQIKKELFKVQKQNKELELISFDWFPFIYNLLKEWTQDQMKKGLYVPVETDMNPMSSIYSSNLQPSISLSQFFSSLQHDDDGDDDDYMHDFSDEE